MIFIANNQNLELEPFVIKESTQVGIGQIGFQKHPL